MDATVNINLLTDPGTSLNSYTDNHWEDNVSTIKKSTPLDIGIREEAARLTFKFTVSPLN